MSVLKNNIPGGTLILLAMVIIPIVWLFITHDTDDVKRDKARAGFIAQIPKAGTLGRWYDDLGSKSYGDATITISAENGRYTASRVSGDGSRTNLVLVRLGEQSNVFAIDHDKFGASYVVTPAGLELHNKNGYIRTAKLMH